MSSFWKWFLIVVAVLIVLGVVILVPGFMFLGHTRFGMMTPFRSLPMMHHFGFLGLGGMFLRFLIPALGIGLLVMLGVAIGKSSRTAPIAGETAQPPVTAATQPGVVSEKVCSQCGCGVEQTWSHCPYCGTKL